MTDNKYWLYLENLRRSGVVNMFGAAQFIVREFGVSTGEAHDILSDWMRNYNPDDYKENDK